LHKVQIDRIMKVEESYWNICQTYFQVGNSAMLNQIQYDSNDVSA